MVGLEHQRPLSHSRAAPAIAGRGAKFHIVVDQCAVEKHFGEAGFGYFLPALVEAGRQKNKVKSLPLAGGLAGVDPRRDAVVDVVILGLGLGAGVNAAAVAPFELLDREAVLDLNLIVAMELD